MSGGPFERIWVLYPRGERSGGPEALHQLVDGLRRAGVEARLVPLPHTRDRERVAEYAVYDAPEADRVVDGPRDAVVAPEGEVDRLRRVHRAQRICWWLSIEYSSPFRVEGERRDRRFQRVLGRPVTPWEPRLRTRLRTHARALRPRRELFASSLHLTQSEYSRTYLARALGVRGIMLTDYSENAAMADIDVRPITERGRTVAYNPAKAPWVQELLGDAVPDVRWRPIQGLDPRGVYELLADSALYFDPGFHPGRDRLPREAARMGAGILLARRGAGAHPDDTPIPGRYKIAATAAFAHDAATTISTALGDLGAVAALQRPYREWVAGERQRFDREIAAVFVDARGADAAPADDSAEVTR